MIIEDNLTLIVTTSPVPSAPSTELLSNVFSSFTSYCPSLLKCKIIVVFDTYDRIADQARLKKGCVTFEEASNYDLYKCNVKALIFEQLLLAPDATLLTSTPDAEFGSSCKEENVVPLLLSRTKDERITFIEPQARIGFSLAVRSALRLADTSYVWVHQHDWTLQTTIPLAAMLDILDTHANDENTPVRYICLPSVRMLEYAEQSENKRHSSFRQLTAELRQDFTPESGLNIPLTPLFFWHDKPHIASAYHYLQNVFPSRLATKRGTFIEDTIGQKLRMQIKNDPEQWKKWATWLYYPSEGRTLCLRHLQGRTSFEKAKQSERIEEWKMRDSGHNKKVVDLCMGTHKPRHADENSRS